MGLREKVSSNPLVGGIVVVVILALAVGIYFALTGGESEYAVRSGETFYYDLQTGQVFQAKMEATEATAPSGGESARAYLFSCGECGEDYFVGYLARINPEVREALGGQPPHPQLLRPKGLDPGNVYLVAPWAEDPSRLEWVEEASEEGRAIKGNVGQQCPDGPPKPCAAGTVRLDS